MARKRVTNPPFRPETLGIDSSFAPVVEDCVLRLERDGVSGKALRRLFARLADRPQAYLEHEILGALAAMISGAAPQAP